MEEKITFYGRHREIILYIVTGVSAVAVNWIDYALFIPFMPMVYANALSWALTQVFCFLVNKIYVFGSRCFRWDVIRHEAAAFFATRGITGYLEIVAQPQLYAMGMDRPVFGVDGMEAKITVCIILSVVNYLSTKLFVFREKGQS